MPPVDQTAMLRRSARRSSAAIVPANQPSRGSSRRAKAATLSQSAAEARIESATAAVSIDAPSRCARASTETQSSEVYPSTAGPPGLKTSPCPSARLRAYRNSMNASSVRNR